ncbi:hypothetical protein [Nocardia sp. IFM 10818]
MTEPIPNATDATRLAIEFLTPWVASGSNEEREEAGAYIGQRLAGLDAFDRIHVIRGQLYLNELLLLALAKANGAEPEAYRDWALEWLQSFSPKLPD